MPAKKGSGKNVTKTIVKPSDSGPSTKKLSVKNGRPSRYHKDFDKIALVIRAELQEETMSNNFSPQV